MKKLIVLFVWLMAGTLAHAQRGGDGGGNTTPEMRAEHQTTAMTEQLSLNSEQQKQVYALQLTRAQKMQEMQQSQDREGMRSLQEEFHKGLSAILTPEQSRKYEKAQADMRSKNPQRGPRNRNR
jgi:periplasmic protein CpxP/Spy